MVEMLEKKTRVHLTGEIWNCLGREVFFTDHIGRPRLSFEPGEAAKIYWVPKETALMDATAMVEVDDRQVAVAGEHELIGWINDYIGLVKPLDNLQSLWHFWLQSVLKQQAEVRGLPDLAAEPKNQACPNYYIVTRGVALVAYFRGMPVQRLLVPAVPVEVDGQVEGYEALMPAIYLLKKQKEAETSTEQEPS